MSLSAALKLRRRHRRHGGTTSTVGVGWGRNVNGQLGTGWSIGGLLLTPTGMEIRNAVGIIMYYGQVLALMPDRTIQCWGQNHAGNLPLSVGPEGKYAGKWEYRTGLQGQKALMESGFSEGEVLAKERAAGANGERLITGQVLFPKDSIVLHKGGTWRAVKANVGEEPGVSGGPNIWVHETPEVAQADAGGVIGFVQFTNSKSLPVQAPLLANVTAAVGMGVHGSALIEGKVKTWGYNRFGILGNGIDLSWGPKPRPFNPRPKLSEIKNQLIGSSTSFRGTFTAGSSRITNLSEIGIPHVSGSGALLPSKLHGGDLFVDPNGLGYIPKAIPEGTEIVDKGYVEAEGYIQMTKPAVGNYTGKIVFQLAPIEQGFWPLNSRFNPGWPVLASTAPATITAIAVGSNPSAYPMKIALTSGGEVLAWGVNTYGVLGNGANLAKGKEEVGATPAYVKESASGPNLKNIKAVACGETFCMALTTDGKVWVWGKVEEGQAGRIVMEGSPGKEKAKKTISTPVLVEGLPTTAGERPAAIAGSFHTCYALLENGDVWSWGGNEKGELGRGVIAGKKSSGNPEPWTPTPARITTLEKVRYIAAGREHACAVTEAGALYTWGGNNNGAIGDGTANAKGEADKGSPTLILSEKVLTCALGEYNTFALLEGSTPPSLSLQVRLLAEGESLGEQSASLKLRWRSAVTSGWQLVFKPSPFLLTEILIEQKREELEGIIEEGEEPAKLEAEEELEELVAEEKAREATQVTLAITPTEVSSGVWEYNWVPSASSPNGTVVGGKWTPSKMTPNLGFTMVLRNPTHKPEWEEKTINTNYLWGSPLSFAAF